MALNQNHKNPFIQIENNKQSRRVFNPYTDDSDLAEASGDSRDSSLVKKRKRNSRIRTSKQRKRDKNCQIQCPNTNRKGLDTVLWSNIVLLFS